MSRQGVPHPSHCDPERNKEVKFMDRLTRMNSCFTDIDLMLGVIVVEIDP